MSLHRGQIHSNPVRCVERAAPDEVRELGVLLAAPEDVIHAVAAALVRVGWVEGAYRPVVDRPDVGCQHGVVRRRRRLHVMAKH